MQSFISLLNSDSSDHSSLEEDYENQLYSQIHHSQEDFSNEKDENDKKKILNDGLASNNNPASSSTPFNYGDRNRRKPHQTRMSFPETSSTPSTSNRNQPSNQTPNKRRHNNFPNNQVHMVKDLIQENYGPNSEIKITSYIQNCEKYLKNKKIKFTPSPHKEKCAKKSSTSHEQINSTIVASDDDIAIVYDPKINQRNDSIILNTRSSKYIDQRRIKKKAEKMETQHTIVQLKQLTNLGRVSCAQSWTEEMCQFYRDSWGDENYNVDRILGSMRRKFLKNRRLWDVIPEDKFWVKPPYNPDRNKRCYNCFQMNHISENCPEPVKKITCLLCGNEGHRAKTCPFKICYNCLNSPETHPPMNQACSHFYFCALCKDSGHSMENCHLYEKMLNGKTPQRRPSCLNCAGAHWYENCPDREYEKKQMLHNNRPMLHNNRPMLHNNRPRRTERKRVTSSKRLKRFSSKFERRKYYLENNNKF